MRSGPVSGSKKSSTPAAGGIATDKKMPRRERKRKRNDDNGEWEEYYEYRFPDDEKAEPKKGNNMRLMEMAQMWKKRKTGQQTKVP